MTKKQKKHKLDSERTQNLDDFDEVYQFGSLFLGRKGRFTYMENLATPEEHKLAMQELHNSMGEYKDSIEKQILELEEILKKYRPFDIIGNMAFRNSIINFDKYKEYESKENLVYAEYIALLYLCKEKEEYPDLAEPVLPDVIEDIQERVRTLFNSQTFYLGFKDIDPENLTPDIFEELRFQILLKSFLIGDMAYHHHRIELTREIFAPITEDLRRIFGFTVDDILIISDGVQQIMSQRLVSKRDSILDIVKELLKVVKKYRLKQRIVGEFPSELVVELGGLKPSEAKKRAISVGIAWVFSNLGETLTFVTGDLAKVTGLDRNIVENYLKLFSLEFGKVEPKYYRYPAPTHPLRTKPIIRVGDKYFCPVPPSIYSDLRLGLEEYLNPANKNSINQDRDIWSNYEKARARYLERKAIEYLGNSLKFAKSYSNLNYTIIENGEKKVTELDGLLTLDNILFIVEAKAGTLSQPARRGAPSMVEDIKELVENAHSQALRAKRYIIESDKPEFDLPNGTKIVLSKDKFDQIFLVNVTLENLDSFIVNLYKLRDLGLVSESEFPWSVCITDLRIISEIVETSCEFVHYLLRRLKINDLGFIEAHDEIDWFGHYLYEGLYFENFRTSSDKKQVLTLGTYTTAFDDYYYHLLGLRQKPATKPQQPMPEIFRQFIDELESVHKRDYLKAACALLDMGDKSRKDFSKAVKEIKKRAIRDRRAHNFTLVFSEDSFGITCVSLPQERFLELPTKLGVYCSEKKRELGLDLWVGFGIVADSNKLISYLLVLDEPNIPNLQNADPIS
jgi:hypothetical protein